MDLKVDPESMRQLVQKAVLDNLTPEAKEGLLVKAIAALFQPDTSGYGRQQSPLEGLFSDAANVVAREIVQRELMKPENRAKVETMVTEAFERVMNDPGRREKAVGRMADALTDALVSKEYR